MAKKENTTKPIVENDLLDNMENSYSKFEVYVEQNKKSLGIIVGIIALIVGGYFAFKYLYLAGQEEEATAAMFQAEQYFQKDSLNKAINGDGNYVGFNQIIEDYGFTKSANLAQYYLGASYMKQGKFTEAIEHLEKFESSDEMLGPMATGLIGDANMELNQTDLAIDFYIKAAKKKSNKMTSPIFYMKAAMAYEGKKDYTNALKTYETIKSDYAESNEGKSVDKYIARAKLLANQ